MMKSEMMMMRSDTIGKLAEALSKAQGEMKNAAKDKDNPFFKSTYADLASVWDACREPLSKNGLCVSQPLNMVEGKLILTTLLLHSSGEWMSSEIPVVPTKNDPQGIGSAITYFRRFCLSALVGVAPAEKPEEDENLDDGDDDGNAASGKTHSASPQTVQVNPIKAILPGDVPKPVKTISDSLKRLHESIRFHRINSKEIQAYTQEHFQKVNTKDLTDDQCSQVIEWVKGRNHEDWDKEAHGKGPTAPLSPHEIN